MSSKKQQAKYPSPDSLEFEEGTPSPAVEHQIGLRATNAQLFLGLSASLLVNVGLVAAMLLQSVNYKPVVVEKELVTGLPVTVHSAERVQVGNFEYSPPRLRNLARNFLPLRYEWDWRDPKKFLRSFEYLAKDSRQGEWEKIMNKRIPEEVVATQSTYRLELDYAAMQVSPLKDGVFEISIPGTAYINDKLRWPDPQSPYPQKIITSFQVRAVEPTDENITGFEIIGTGKEIYF